MTQDMEPLDATWVLAAEDGSVLAATSGYSSLLAKYPELQDYLKMWHRVWPGSRAGWPSYERELSGQDGQPALHLHAVRMMLASAVGASALSPQICGMLIKLTVRPPANGLAAKFDLTATEQRVAEMVSGGDSSVAVASRLGMSVHTVRAQLKRLYAKTGVHSRAGLVRVLMERKLAGAEVPSAADGKLT